MSKRRKCADIVAAFGRAVRARRVELGMTQEQLAAVAKVNRTYIGDIERGARNVALRNVQKIASALRTSVARFFADYHIED